MKPDNCHHHFSERFYWHDCNAYGSRTPLRLLGKFTATLSNSEKYDVADIYVVQGTHNAGSLLGSGSATALGILRIVNHVKLDGSQNGESDSATVKGARLSKQKDQTCPVTSVDKLVAEYDDLFQGIGKLKGVQVKLHIHLMIKYNQSHRNIAC